MILLYRNRSDLSSSCIIINQCALLEEVNGKLFAPVTFKEHCQITTNTGIMLVSLLSKTFLDCFKNLYLVVVVLTILGFCHELLPTVLKTMFTNLSMDPQAKSDHCFFLALVSVDHQLLLTIVKGFGWAVFCNNPYHILSTYVLQVIIP